MAQCNSCGAEIIFAKTVNGKLIPLDVEPAEDGNLALDELHNVARQATLMDAVKYKTHFATCPNSAKHRKKK